MRRDRSVVQLRAVLATLVMVLCVVAGPAYSSPVSTTIKVDPAILTPYSSGGCARFATGHQCPYVIEGTAPPGASVTVIVSDQGTSSYVVRGQTQAMSSDDTSMDVHAGDWIMPGLDVTNLGTHGPLPSVLTYTVVATNADGTQTSASVSVTKYAASSGDVFAPNVYLTSVPPADWSPFTKPVDTAWPGKVAVAAESCATPTPGSCQTPVICGLSFCASPVSQDPYHAEIAGYVRDNDPSSYGVASEIADTEIVITEDSTHRVLTDVHPIYRGLGNDGTAAWFGWRLNYGDYVNFQTYDWTLTGIDAAGNPADGSSGRFTVLP